MGRKSRTLETNILDRQVQDTFKKWKSQKTFEWKGAKHNGLSRISNITG